jgi:hypothetical protein
VTAPLAAGWPPPTGPAGCTHGPGPGRFDETARRLSHSELAAATRFRVDGHTVTALPEPPTKGPHPDLLVCGGLVEVKGWLRVEQRRGPPGSSSVYNRLVQGAQQAPTVVLVGHGTGLTEAAARRGVDRYTTQNPTSPIRDIRVLGDGFELAWNRSLLADRGPDRSPEGRDRPSERAGRGLDGPGR